ncbi:MAG: hypothetical protein WAT39_22965 [Planctomycetota bacterium]
MNAVHSLLSLGCLTVALAAQASPIPVKEPFGPELVVQLDPAIVRLTIVSEQRPFVGIFLISAEPTLAHYLTGLPPLLADATLFAWGYCEAARFQVSVPDMTFPAGMMIYAQGVTISDVGILATNIGEFVLDVTVGGGGR